MDGSSRIQGSCGGIFVLLDLRAVGYGYLARRCTFSMKFGRLFRPAADVVMVMH